MNRLITIGPSPYVEKARWALQHHGIPFVEESHVPIFHWSATRPRGRRTVPLLITASGEQVGESSDIVAWADAQRPEAPPLLPPDLREDVAWMDQKFGTHGRRLAYHVLFEAPATFQVLFAGAPAWQLRGLRLAYPLWRRLVGAGLDVTPKRAAASISKLRALFEEVGQRLADRPWLAADRFTAVDLTFAAHTAAILKPPQHGWPLVDLGPLEATVPQAQEAAALREELRNTAAGRHALKVYAELR